MCLPPLLPSVMGQQHQTLLEELFPALSVAVGEVTVPQQGLEQKDGLCLVTLYLLHGCTSQSHGDQAQSESLFHLFLLANFRLCLGIVLATGNCPAEAAAFPPAVQYWLQGM